MKPALRGVSEYDFEANFMHSLVLRLGLVPQSNKNDARAIVERYKKVHPEVEDLISQVYIPQAYEDAKLWTKQLQVMVSKEASVTLKDNRMARSDDAVKIDSAQRWIDSDQAEHRAEDKHHHNAENLPRDDED